MIVTILLLVLFFIIMSFLVYFLVLMFPAVKKMTGVETNALFSVLEHDYSKLRKQETIKKSDKKAYVRCACNKTFADKQQVKKIGQSCSVICNIYGSLNDCKFSCIGMGDCAKACDREGIIIKDNCAIVTNLCNGCGKCVSVCPKNLISICDVNESKTFFCKNKAESLTTCSQYKKEQNIEYEEHKCFKI